jgi:hypothetical protein
MRIDQLHKLQTSAVFQFTRISIMQKQSPFTLSRLTSGRSLSVFSSEMYLDIMTDPGLPMDAMRI